MIQSELEKLLREGERDRVEFTISLTDIDKFSEAICAFANDLPGHLKPGYLFVGTDPTGLASGARIDDQLLQRLAAIRSDGHIQPLPTMNVEKKSLGGGEMAVVEVFPADLPPVRYKGRTYIRVGPRKAIATVAEERLLAERRIDRSRTWDGRPCFGATLADISLELFYLTYLPNAIDVDLQIENHRAPELQLASLRFFDFKHQCLTNAGILIFGKDPQSFFPGAYIQYVRYRGPTQADEVVSERRFSGDLLDILRDLDRLAQEMAEQRPLALKNLKDQTVYDYPPRAMHELLMNAVVHRNYEGSNTPVMVNHYDDRVEIQNPGGLFGDLTPVDFPRLTAYRNPILAEAAKTLGFVNKFGRGIAIVEQEVARNGSPPPQFDFQPNFFLAQIARRQ